MKWLFFLFALITQIFADESVTSKDTTYINTCLQAVTTPYYFQNFRSLPEYSHVVEISNGKPFADFLLNESSDAIWAKINLFKKLDSIGNPQTHYYKSLGNFSATALRYIVIADEILSLFKLPENPKIVEIGGGFGGQCYILSRVQPHSQYIIYDLPEPSMLIEKVMTTLDVENVVCLLPDAPLPDEQVDLLISNYSFSACDLQMQTRYIEQVLKKADRGYLIYNQISEHHGIKSLNPIDFLKLLAKHGIYAKVLDEKIRTSDQNLLIVWDKTL